MAVPEGSTAEIRSPKRALAVVVGIVFVDLLGFGVVIPILPYYVRSFAVSDAVIGLLAASYSLLQFLAAPTLGRISDQYGRRPSRAGPDGLNGPTLPHVPVSASRLR